MDARGSMLGRYGLCDLRTPLCVRLDLRAGQGYSLGRVQGRGLHSPGGCGSNSARGENREVERPGFILVEDGYLESSIVF